MKTYLSHRGYAIEKKNNEALIEKLKKELTVKPKSIQLMSEDASSFPVYRESEKKFYMPKYYGLKEYGKPTSNTLHEGEDCPDLIFNGTLRDIQVIAVDAFVKSVQNPIQMGGILSLPCGFGKTICALYLSTVFKKRTLVVCHTNFLMDQWIERIQQYIPTASIGKIKQKICEVRGKDIVVASLQSLAMRTYDPELFSTFGFVIFDECHHLGAEVFSRCLPLVTCKRMLGLSATLTRKDGLSKVFEWYLGKPVYSVKRKDSDVIVQVERYYDPQPEYCTEHKLWFGGGKKLNLAKMINQVCDYGPRNKRLIQILKECLEKDPNRKVLILSERRNHLQELENLLRIEGYTSIGYYVGGMNKYQLDEGSQGDIILATFQLASEAMDIPKLNTLVLASSVSSVEQPVGRIQRKKKEEQEYTPLVIDFIDEFSIFERQGIKRLAFYKKNGYDIRDASKVNILLEPRKYNFIEDEDDVMH